MDRLQLVLDRLPSFYNKDAQDSKIRAIVSAITTEFALYDDQMDAVDNMGGIDTTYGIDIDRRWGKIMNIPRNPNEDDDLYRNRIKVSVSDLSGGTEHAIKYAIAVVLGINNDPVATESRITVSDAWLYNGPEPIDKSKGAAVVLVDLDSASFAYKDSMNSIVENIIAKTKASGTKIQLIFQNYRIMTYSEMQPSTYVQLATFRYNQLGDTK